MSRCALIPFDRDAIPKCRVLIPMFCGFIPIFRDVIPTFRVPSASQSPIFTVSRHGADAGKWSCKCAEGIFRDEIAFSDQWIRSFFVLLRDQRAVFKIMKVKNQIGYIYFSETMHVPGQWGVNAEALEAGQNAAIPEMSRIPFSG